MVESEVLEVGAAGIGGLSESGCGKAKEDGEDEWAHAEPLYRMGLNSGFQEESEIQCISKGGYGYDSYGACASG
jgi:hypothetical protein